MNNHGLRFLKTVIFRMINLINSGDITNPDYKARIEGMINDLQVMEKEITDGKVHNRT